jgi:hypothetical protein
MKLEQSGYKLATESGCDILWRVLHVDHATETFLVGHLLWVRQFIRGSNQYDKLNIVDSVICCEIEIEEPKVAGIRDLVCFAPDGAMEVMKDIVVCDFLDMRSPKE